MTLARPRGCPVWVVPRPCRQQHCAGARNYLFRGKNGEAGRNSVVGCRAGAGGREEHRLGGRYFLFRLVSRCSLGGGLLWCHGKELQLGSKNRQLCHAGKVFKVLYSDPGVLMLVRNRQGRIRSATLFELTASVAQVLLAELEYSGEASFVLGASVLRVRNSLYALSIRTATHGKVLLNLLALTIPEQLQSHLVDTRLNIPNLRLDIGFYRLLQHLIRAKKNARNKMRLITALSRLLPSMIPPKKNGRGRIR